MMRRPRRFPIETQQRAVEIGVDELQQRLEYELRSRPRALKHARDRYRRFGSEQLRRIERVHRTAD